MIKRNFSSGDTLIEVIFAFAILATIIGFAYSGAISARRNAVMAEQRTQALFVAQYQSQALSAYRESLPWNEDIGTPNFVSGGGGGINNSSGISLDGASYCMNVKNNGSNNQWQLQNVSTANCDDLVSELPADGINKKVRITFAPQSPAGCNLQTCNSIIANVGVYWVNPFNQPQNVQNIVILTRSR